MNRLLVILSVWVTFSVGAQSSEKYNSEYASFFRGEELFEKEQYGAARKEFRGFIDQFQQKNDPLYLKALYYEGVSALELFNNDGVTLLEDFNRNYPESIYRTRIYYKLGRYYYQKKDYKEAIAWFSKLSAFDVDPEDKDEFYFKLGYANFQESNFPAARAAFYEVKDGTSQYGAPSLYYYSHIAYMEKSYQTALEGFEKLLSDKRFKEVVPYYITQIYYLQGRYADVTRFAPALVDSVKTSSVSSMNHLIGDAFYRVGKYDEAVLYLEMYNNKENTTREEDYQLGYAYYRSSNYDKAIKLFDRVSRVKDTLGQIAFYHIGECYLKKGNNAYARTAFEAAAVMENADPKVQEDALYNYAILSYKLDINPYDEAVEALELYLKKYPNSDRKNEVYQYLVNVYTSTNNYAQALASLDKLANKDIRLKTAYQIVAFNHGVELFQKSEYTKAIAAFALVDKYPVDAEIAAKAKFWTADAYYYMGSKENGEANYAKAIQAYKTFINSPGNHGSKLRADAFYNLGYAYLNTVTPPEKNPQLESAFKDFLSQPNLKKEKKADAYMRLGDYYYISKKNDQAIKSYKEAYDLKAGNEDQALYFMALTYGLSGKLDDKIRHMQDIVNNYPRSQYMMPSIYEISMAYRAKEQDDKALPYFQQLVKDYPNSNLTSEAQLNIADIYFKKKDYAKSEALYRSVLDKYGTDRETCASSVAGLKNIYKAKKEFDKITELSVYKCAEDVLDDLEDTYYQAGVEPYMDSSFTEAIPDLEKYLQKYPEGKYNIEITAYLANSYYRTGKTEQAYMLYRALLDKPDTEFTELAAMRISRDSYNNGDYENALVYYTRLEKITSRPATIHNTQIGLMRCHFLLENWANAAEYAKKVLAPSSSGTTQALTPSASVRQEAEYVKGISLYHEESYTEAKPSLEWVVKNTTGELALEAKFSLAEMYYKQKENVKAEAEIRALLKMKPAYDFWTAKALILQSKVLIAKDDLFQAEHTLKSVIDNYTDEDDGILLEANQLWDELMQLKTVPKTVQEKQKTEIEINEKRK